MFGFAYVKFIEDSEKLIVPIKDIKNKGDELLHGIFDPNKIYKIKYTDGHYYKGNIICLAENEVKLVELITTKRMRMPVHRFGETDDDTNTTDAEEAGINNNSKRNKNKQKDEVDKENMNEIVTDINDNDVLTEFNDDVLSELNNDTNINPPRQDREKITKLQTEILQLRRREKELQNTIEKLVSINLKYQETVLKKFDEMLNMNQHNNQNSNQPTTGNNELPAVGARTNEGVHLGRGIFIQEHIYDTIIDLKSKNSARFVRELAVAIFGIHVLITSSVTGQQCNRTKTQKPALEPNKIMAIHDIVRYRLEVNRESKEKITEFCNKINQIISQKIQDLQRPKSQQNKIQADDREDFVVGEDGVLVPIADEGTE